MFFSELNQLMQDGQILHLNLLKKGGVLHVSLAPKVQNMAEAAANKLIPLSLSGTPAELDKEFLAVISEPVRERYGLISNAGAFMENTRSAAGKKGAQGGNKEQKPSRKEQLLAQGQAHENAGRWPEAYAIYKKLSDAEPKDAELKSKAVKVWENMYRIPLFPEEKLSENPGAVSPQVPEGGARETPEAAGNGIMPARSEPAAEDTRTTAAENNWAETAQEEPCVDMFASLVNMTNRI